MSEDASSVLVIAGLGTQAWLRDRPSKIESHIRPISIAVDKVTFVTAGPVSNPHGDIEFVEITRWDWWPLILVHQLFTGVRLARRENYDLIVSFSLIPFGMQALMIGTISRTPSHLGIIGGDLDVHADAWYGAIVRWLFRRFDIVTGGGTEYKNRLVDHGVDPEKIHIVLHPVSRTFSETTVSDNPQYDILWLTRMSEVKDPIFFLKVLDELERRGLEPEVAMVGNGPLLEEVRAEIDRRGMSDNVTLPGWSETPEEYYREAKLYVLTSQREMLPLTLVEAMLVGVVPVVPRLGAIPDIVEHGVNGYIIEQKEVTSHADALAELLKDEERVGNMSRKATELEDTVSQEAVVETWCEIFDEVS